MVEMIDLITGYRTGKSARVVSHDINASLQSGNLTSLLGPNGAGKSTLLKTLSGFLPPLGGEVRIDGIPISSIDGPELARLVGVVLTERPAVVAMTVEEMVSIGRSPYTGFRGRLSDADREIVERAMSLTGVTEMRSRTVDTLSDGERQKVMIAKALAQATPVIYLDEPSAFLDYPSKVELMLMLRSLAHDEGKTILLSTHDLNIALELSDTLFLVDKSIGYAAGPPAGLAADGSLEHFFSSPAIALSLDPLQFHIRHAAHPTPQSN